LLINEIIANTDGPNLTNSVFVYKDKGGKISFGPIWDLDVTFGWDWGIHSHIYFVTGTSYQLIPKHAFFRRFYEDPVFLVTYKEHWNEKQAKVIAVTDFIDSLGAAIRPAVMQDAERWAIPNNGYIFDTYDTNHTRQTALMVAWWNSRLLWLNIQLNQVEILPAITDFGTFDYSSMVSQQKLTIVAYSEMENLTARFEEEFPDFEITGGINQIATGKGGYLATIDVKPKNGLHRGTYTDGLMISGTNQGKRFLLRASLQVNVTKDDLTNNDIQQHNMLQASIRYGQLHISGINPGETLYVYNLAGALVYQTIAADTEIDVPLREKGLYSVRAGYRTAKIVYFH
jgi:hypothetical protein